MQLYQGLPIITNKITEDEKKGIPHHLLGCIGLEQETWTVGKFVSNALAVVCKITLKFTTIPSHSCSKMHSHMSLLWI
jgi:tRNA A37 N6-isopentenylltransferase MiaA